MAKLLGWATRWIGTKSEQQGDVPDAKANGEEPLDPTEGLSELAELQDSPIVHAAASPEMRELASDESIKAGTRAYDYVMRKLGGMGWEPPLNTPEAVATWLEIPQDSFAALREGDLGQVLNISEALKELFKGSGHEREIDSFLTPRPRAVA